MKNKAHYGKLLEACVEIRLPQEIPQNNSNDSTKSTLPENEDITQDYYASRTINTRGI